MRHGLFFLSFCCIFFSYTQERTEIIQQRIEFISEQMDNEELDITDIFQVLYDRIDRPLNLNLATKNQLSELGLLTDVQINDLLLHRERFGKLITIYELQSLKFWDLTIIELILPFVTVDNRLDQLHVSFKEAIRRGKFEWYLRYQRIVEKQKGYTAANDSVLQASNTYYHGNPDKYYTRFRYSYYSNLSLGFTAEKDPGEQFFKGKQKYGFDFYSIHAFYKGGKYLRGVALGDYQVQIGQGLNLWSGYSFSKSADVTMVKKNAIPLKPYTSSDEVRFLRGAAVHLGYKNVELLAFASVKNIDGALTTIESTDSLTNSSDNFYASSINLTGFHRTNSELAKKNLMTEWIIGSTVQYEKRNLHVGLALVNWNYDKPYNKPILPYNQFDFRGKTTTSISADYSYVIRNFVFFGEASFVTHSKSWANLHGLLIAMSTKASLALVYRNYQRGYETFYNTAFSEGGRMANNERGIYAGLNVNLTKKWIVNTYFDLFEFPWLKFQVNQPSKGYEFLTQLTYKIARNVEIYGRFRQQNREKNNRNSDGSIKGLEPVVQRNFRLNASYKIGESFYLKSRVEYVNIQRPSSKTEHGVVLSQDFSYRPKKLPFELTFRYALFDTDSYDSKIYTMESNALYVYSSPAYYYQGNRAYLLLRIKLVRNIDFWARYGIYLYSNRDVIGSVGEQINGPIKSDITLQLRVKF